MSTAIRVRDLSGGTEIITESDCWTLLESAQIGRVVVSNESGVDVFPVAFRAGPGELRFATNLGAKLLGVFAGQSVFEVDHFDERKQSGWSVVLRGRFEISEMSDAERDVLPQWAGPKKYLVRLTPTSVTGRRLGLN